MRVLFDTDVILDVLLDRPGFVEPASALWEASQEGRVDAYISAITPVNVFYIARKLKGLKTARYAVEELLAAFRVCAVDHRALQAALSLPLRDYEDGVQVASALASQLDAIVTRNVRDYEKAAFPVFSPPELLARLADLP
ncbi:MAG TPA: PIN domain-containing protein [Blastocatellia bacterium]|nr:PIN domain-containing protein [Blastocatellia bacterium]